MLLALLTQLFLWLAFAFWGYGVVCTEDPNISYCH